MSLPIGQIKRSRFGTMVQRLLGMDAAAPAPSLIQHVQPVMPVEQLSSEHEFLRQVQRCVGGMPIAAGGAGTFNVGQLACASAGMMLAVDYVIVSAAAACQVWMGVEKGPLEANLPPATTGGVDLLDARGTGLPVGFMRQNNALANLNTHPAGGPTFALAANTPLVIPIGAVLVNGWDHFIAFNTANIVTYVSWIWRERALPDVELGNG